MAFSTAAVPPLFVLCSMLAASASASPASAHKPKPGVCSEAACAAQALSADDDVSLLQHRSLFGPLPTPTPPPLHGNVGFEWWPGSTCWLRPIVTATLSGSTYSMLLDTGSSTLALCNGTTRDGVPVPPLTPPPLGKPNGFNQCRVYGSMSCSGAHGFTGPSFDGELKLENLDAPMNYVVMAQKIGEKGNACGIPPALAQKQGTQRLEGIFGFGGSAVNTGCKGQYTPCNVTNGCDNHCDGEVQDQTAPLTALLQTLTQVDRVWGLGWPVPGASPSRRLLGPGSGELLFGSAAKEKLQSFPVQDSVVGEMAVNLVSGTYYWLQNFGTKAFSVSGGVSKELPDQEGEVPKVNVHVDHILDTGTPFIELPTDTFIALKKYFKEGTEDAEAMVHIYVNALQPLKLLVSARVWNLGIFHLPSGNLMVLGMPLMMWYEYIQFDIQGEEMTFVERPEAARATFMEEVVKAGEAACGL